MWVYCLHLKINGQSLSSVLRDVERSVASGDLQTLEASFLSWQIPVQLSREILRVASSLISFRPKKPRLGKFIVVSGIDKTGKETQVFNPSRKENVVSLVGHLKGKGYQVLGIAQPSYDTKMGRLVACYLGRNVEGLSIEGVVDKDVAWILWSLDRAQHNEKVAYWLALSPAHIVVSKRWTESNLVYQAVNGINPDRVLAVEKNMVKQDYTIILQLPVSAALERLSTLHRDAYEQSYTLQRAADLYSSLESLFPYGKVYRIDASADIVTVNRRLLELVDSILKGK